MFFTVATVWLVPRFQHLPLQLLSLMQNVLHKRVRVSKGEQHLHGMSVPLPFMTDQNPLFVKAGNPSMIVAVTPGVMLGDVFQIRGFVLHFLYLIAFICEGMTAVPMKRTFRCTSLVRRQ